MSLVEKNNTERITSIDALRAFALFGIILVHAIGGFCMDVTGAIKTPVDTFLVESITLLFKGKCATIFCILFGVSFYIILRKPNYPTSKFVWRCFLLFLIGLFNKFFYKPDALMIYGLMGMVLACFRNLKTNNILLLSLFFFFMSFVTRIVTHYFQLIPSELFTPNYRYEQGHTALDIIYYWPISVMWYIEHTIHGGFFGILGKFTLGYWIGRKGFVEVMDKRVDLKTVGVSGISFFIMIAIKSYLEGSSVAIIQAAMHFVNIAVSIISAFFYAILFIWLYNHVSFLKYFLKYMESYGKLGLTNYSFQGIFMVLFLCDFGLGFKYQSITFYVCAALVFYIIQLVFSYMWLKKFKNGPLEYLWRCATERRWLPLLVKEKR